jgi:hypothetical protein
MQRIQHEYIHTSYRPPSKNTYSAVSSGLRSGHSPDSQSLSVLVRNPTLDNTQNSSDSGQNIAGSHSQASALPPDDLYYASMPVGGQTSGVGSAIMPTPRGTKRHRTSISDESSRQHRRLTTKEEVALFDICNQNAATFGSRSNLCKWWQTIASEFKRTHEGRSYSWHSVRRKVEMVTRQRIKFLEDRHRDSNAATSRAEEAMNPQWLAAVDAWIPTWQHWEETENRRIAKRDEIKNRRVSQPQPYGRDSKTDDSWRLPGSTATSPDIGAAMMGILPSNEVTSPTPAPIPPPNFLESPPSPTAPTLKLPPGFETMFSNPVQPPLSSTPPVNDGRMVSAVLETLGKLNKHLDAASSEPSAASPMFSALVQAAAEAPSKDPDVNVNAHAQVTHVDIERMKQELRIEMQGQFRRELERSRVAMEEKLDSVQQTQEMILEMLRQEPGR